MWCVCVCVCIYIYIYAMAFMGLPVKMAYKFAFSTTYLSSKFIIFYLIYFWISGQILKVGTVSSTVVRTLSVRCSVKTERCFDLMNFSVQYTALDECFLLKCGSRRRSNWPPLLYKPPT